MGATIKEYYISINGKKAFKFDIESIENEFINTKKLTNEELNNYPFKTIQVFVLGTDKNDYKVSTMYVKNGVDKGEIPEIVWDINGTKEKEIQFKSKSAGKESIYIYYK